MPLAARGASCPWPCSTDRKKTQIKDLCRFEERRIRAANLDTPRTSEALQRWRAFFFFSHGTNCPSQSYVCAMSNLPALLAQIRPRIFTIRKRRVMLDAQLAELYGVKPIRLREQVRRNIGRLPEDFMFQLNVEEAEALVSQNAIPSRRSLGGALPLVFTQEGIAMLSGVLRSPSAVRARTSSSCRLSSTQKRESAGRWGVFYF